MVVDTQPQKYNLLLTSSLKMMMERNQRYSKLSSFLLVKGKAKVASAVFIPIPLVPLLSHLEGFTSALIAGASLQGLNPPLSLYMYRYLCYKKDFCFEEIKILQNAHLKMFYFATF